jgi:hypothetical protein
VEPQFFDRRAPIAKAKWLPSAVLCCLPAFGSDLDIGSGRQRRKLFLRHGFGTLTPMCGVQCPPQVGKKYRASCLPSEFVSEQDYINRNVYAQREWVQVSRREPMAQHLARELFEE